MNYFYDGMSVIEERDATTKGLMAHYRYADRLLSVDTPTRTERQYYHQDGMGSTANLSSPSGATLHSYSLVYMNPLLKTCGA